MNIVARGEIGLRTCPTKLVEQAHRSVEMTVDGFSDIPYESTVCDNECPGPLLENKASLVRTIGSRLLHPHLDPTVEIPTCPKI